MKWEHPFARYVSILGQGRHGTRSLTRQEAREAMTMVLEGRVKDIQLGAFLTLLRVKEETSQELAGFHEAVIDSLRLPANFPRIDLNWPTYAGKKRQPPWYLLSALLLAENGIKVFMHGTRGEDEERMFAESFLEQLDLKSASSFEEAALQIESKNMAYLDLEMISPELSRLLKLCPLLGLRLPIHTLARLLNPVRAPYSMQGIFHRGYQDLHREAGLLLGQPHLAVIKGEGGEAERVPHTSCRITIVCNGKTYNEEWPEIMTKIEGHRESDPPSHLVDVWQGRKEDDYGRLAVTGTLAIALYLTGKAACRIEAEVMAAKIWKKRRAANL